jgi:hypothetical protein
MVFPVSLASTRAAMRAALNGAAGAKGTARSKIAGSVTSVGMGKRE